MFTDARTDARTPDRPVYYKLTFEPSAQVSLKKNLFSTQLSMKFILLINVKMPTFVGILTFISKINDWIW